MSRLEQLWEYARTRGNIGIRVNLGSGGLKLYLLNDFDEPPALVVELENTVEERVFLMFRYPDLNCPEVREYTFSKIKRALDAERLASKGYNINDLVKSGVVSYDDLDFKDKYFASALSLFEVRESLRTKFKDILFANAKSMIGEVIEQPKEEEKPETEQSKSIVKSKTVWVNVLLTLLVYYLQLELTPEEIATLYAMANIVLRLITNKSISEFKKLKEVIRGD